MYDRSQTTAFSNRWNHYLEEFWPVLWLEINVSWQCVCSCVLPGCASFGEVTLIRCHVACICLMLEINHQPTRSTRKLCRIVDANYINIINISCHSDVTTHSWSPGVATQRVINSEYLRSRHVAIDMTPGGVNCLKIHQLVSYWRQHCLISSDRCLWTLSSNFSTIKLCACIHRFVSLPLVFSVGNRIRWTCCWSTGLEVLRDQSSFSESHRTAYAKLSMPSCVHLLPQLPNSLYNVVS